MFPTSTHTHPSPPKRPRLSLQIKTPSAPQTLGKSVTALKSDVDPSSPTAFNTLSNAYAAAIENSSPRTAHPGREISREGNGKEASIGREANTRRGTSLRLQTNSATRPTQLSSPLSATTQTHTPFTYTPPQSAHPKSPAPSTSSSYNFTATPTSTLSRDGNINPGRSSPLSPLITRRRATVGSHHLTAPYAHPQALHSILRNSPLPSRRGSAASDQGNAGVNSNDSVERRSKSPPAKKVAYLDPLTQTITTNKYVKSHIELLAEEASPLPDECIDVLDLEGGDTRDGGMTPGPFEEMRRRLAGLGEDKKSKREKKRKWVWTIGGDEGEDVDVDEMAEKKEETPVTAVFCGSDEQMRE